MKLSTLRTVALHGPVGELTIDDPGLVALLVILAVSGRAGIERDELMVLLTPDATSDRARNELDRLLAAARFVTGDNTLIVHPATRYGLREGALELDIEVLPADSGHGCDEFLSGFTLPGSPERSEERRVGKECA